MIATTLVIFGSALGLLYLFLTRKNDYWKRRGLVSPKPVPLLGNYADFLLQKKNLADTVTDICNQLPDEPIIGAYYGTEPVVVVKDPELLKLIVTKDFCHFSSREISGHQHKESGSRNVFSEYGDNWRVLRQNLTPLFSSAKMKKMFHLIESRTQDLERLLATEISSEQEHEVRRLMGKYTMDCIGSCFFGLETKVMKEGKDNPFLVISEKIFELTPIKLTKIAVRTIWPSIFYGIGLEAFPAEVTKFFKDLIVGVFADREYKPGTRNDFIDFILGFKQNNYIIGDDIKSLKHKSEAKEKIKLDVDDEMLAAQCMVFFSAGFETSAGTMSFALYELSKHPDVLQRVHEEIDQHLVKTGGKITYDCVTDLPYLEACVDEALRLYPVLGAITREVIEDYELPSGLVLEKGMRVHLPVQYLQTHADYFPEPAEFRPERFLGQNKQDIKPYTYMPFGDGPRICIGMRFARMQMMAGLVTLLREYTVELPPHIPRTLEFEPRAFTTQPKIKLHLNFIPRKLRNATKQE